MQKSGIVEKISAIVSNILRDNEIELVDITYRREAAGNVLRVYADTKTGITVNECARMSEIISEALDAAGIIEDRYILEVASPGLDRPLRSKKDFLRHTGRVIRIHTYAPIQNKKEFTGKLSAIEQESVSISTKSGARISIPLDKISSARLDF